MGHPTDPVIVNSPKNERHDGDPHRSTARPHSDPIATLEAQHRIEEACETYALYPSFDETGYVTLPVMQLGPPDLASVLVRELVTRGLDAELDAEKIRIQRLPGLAGARHLAERLEDALFALRPHHPARFLSRRAPGSVVPPTEALPRSRRLIERAIANDFVPDDKKPPVIDLYRSTGPYMASVDDAPLVFFDSSSQIASHGAGLNPPPVLEALWTGRFGNLPIQNPTPEQMPVGAFSALAGALRRAAKPGLSHVAFCNSGAEANELAIRIASRQRPGRRALIAFEGSFHGRSILSLHLTYNPKKRLRFELDGHQARWVAWPRMPAGTPEPHCSEEELAPWRQRDAGNLPPAPSGDALAEAEHASLCAVVAALADDQVAAIIAEPMQSEGGDRLVSARFLAKLSALAHAWSVPFILDEVQTGFHLGGPFFWHRRSDLPIEPDIIACAKKCQVGAVISRWPAEVPCEANATGAMRGLIYSELLADADKAGFETLALSMLKELQARHPDTVRNPRATAYAFAFDLPSPEALSTVIGQRFWRALLAYGAGDRTMRFRGHPMMSAASITALGERLDAALQSLDAGEGTAWQQVTPPDPAPIWPPAPAKLPKGYQLMEVAGSDWSTIQDAVRALQEICYEPARRDDLDTLSALLREPGAQCLIVVKGNALPPLGSLVGTAFAFPLEHVAHLDGPAQDPMLGKSNTLYSADVTVHPDHRGQGLGLVLKEAQIAHAMTQRDASGHAQFAFITSRNRVGATPMMNSINLRFGAWEARRFEGQYGETDAQASYMRLPLTTPRLPRLVLDQKQDSSLNLRDGLLSRIDSKGAGGDSLAEGLLKGRLNGAIANKISLCNFATPATARAFEMLRALAPQHCRHLAIASGRSETCDKGLRALKFHRPNASVAISIGPVYCGTTSAAARSASLPAEHPDNWFNWPQVHDPCEDAVRALSELRHELDSIGADKVLGVIIEPVFTRTGRAVPLSFWDPLRALCDEFGVPLIALENTTAAYRSGRGMWRSDSLPINVDAVWWFVGGQLGLAFLSDDWYVPEKLTLISTWDGDEVSLVRAMWELRIARALAINDTSARLRAILAPLGTVEGEGLFLSVETQHARAIHSELATQGIQIGREGDDRLIIAPALNVSKADLSRLETSLSPWTDNA